MKKIFRFTVLSMAFAMLVALLSFSTFAQASATDVEPDDASVILEGSVDLQYSKCSWVLTSDGTLTFSSNAASGRWNEIPYYNQVTENGWLDYAIDIKKVIIGEGLMKIGANAFSNCKNLKTVEMSSVGQMAHNVFQNCSSLKTIYITGNEPIEGTFDLSGVYSFNSGNQFIGCGMTSVILSDKLTRIPDSFFQKCTNLESVTIPTGVTGIGKYAFAQCTGLESIEIPNSVTTIGDYAFYYTSTNTKIHVVSGVMIYVWEGGLKNITIPDSVTSIGVSAFEGCGNLKDITIGESVTSIGENAFGQCTNVESITFKTKNATIDTTAFDNCLNLKTIYLYKNSTADSFFSDTEYTKIYLDNESEHLPVGSWQMDSKYHWHIDADGMTVVDKAEHTADVVWSSDGKTHWRACTACDYKLNEVKCSEGNDGKCTVCLTAVAEHSIINTWKTEEGKATHWKVCSKCGVKVEETAHVEGENGRCKDCGLYIHVHAQQGEWKKDSAGHWKTCTCGKIVDVTGAVITVKDAHVDVAGDGECDVCGYHNKHVAAGDWTKTDKEHYQLCACGTVMNRGAHADGSDADKLCDICGYNCETTESGDHVCAPNVNVWQYDSSNHWRVCTCGETQFYKAAHTMENGKCTICGYDSHIHSAQGAWKKDSVNHWKLCSCGAKVGKAMHTDTDGDKACDFCLYSMSNSGARLDFSSAAALAGKTVSIDITLSGNPGISGLLIKLNFDRNVLELKDISYQTWKATDNLDYCGDGRDVSLLFYRTSNIYVNDVLATLVFEVAEDAEVGEYPIEITFVEATNENTADVLLTLQEGKVTVCDSIVGDINSDGKIDIKDTVAFAQYLAGWDVSIDTDAADCNGDGEISIKDIVLLAQYLAGWNVTLG